jgi:hypothetical protein
VTDGRDADLERDEGEHVDVVALVLGDVEGRQRAELAAHVLRCSACRREYDEIAATVGDLLPGVPAVQPPLGFDEDALRRLGLRPTARPARQRRRWLAATAAAVALVVAGVLAWWAFSVGDGSTDLATLHLTDGGAPTGTVSLSELDGDPLMVVAILDAPPDVSYFCRTVLADGTTVDSESWPAGDGAWIVPLPADADVATVEIIPAGTDHVWSTATFE